MNKFLENIDSTHVQLKKDLSECDAKIHVFQQSVQNRYERMKTPPLESIKHFSQQPRKQNLKIQSSLTRKKRGYRLL